MYILAGVLASQACSIAPGIEEAGVKKAMTALIEIIIDAAKRLTWKPFKYIEATIFIMIKQTAILLATLVKSKVNTHKAIKKPICPLPANKGAINLASQPLIPVSALVKTDEIKRAIATKKSISQVNILLASAILSMGLPSTLMTVMAIQKIIIIPKTLI